MTATASSSRRRILWVCLLTLLLAAVGVLWEGGIRRPAGPAYGESLHGTAPASRPASRGTVRVGTFNIHGGIGADGRRDLERIVATLGDLDLVALNEIHAGRFGPKPDQAEQLGRKLDRLWLFAPTETRWWRPHFGNGVLSRWPCRHWSRLPLPGTRSAGFRNAVLMRVAVDGGDLRVLVTHLDHRIDRALQLKAVLDLFLSLESPAILMGDLNTFPGDPQMQPLLESGAVQDAIGAILGDKAQRRVDWILLRGLKARDAGMVDNGASDHPMFWAEIEMGR